MVTNIALDLLGPCNYSCQYCREGKPMPYPDPVLHNLKHLKEIYALLGETYTVMYARGSEPALHPQMADVARIVVPAGTLHISTNLSMPVGEWLPGPQNIQLLATIHPEAEADLPGFMARVKDAVDRGYDIRVQALGDKDRPEWRKMLQEVGVTQHFTVYKIRSDSRWRAESAEIVPPPPGTLCNAGFTSLFITARTELLRCLVAQEPIQTPFTKSMPCRKPKADTRCTAYWIREG